MWDKGSSNGATHQTEVNMSYDFTHDFAVETTFGMAEGTVNVDYYVIDDELFIKNVSTFEGKLHDEEGDVICDFKTQKHHVLGGELYKKLYKDIVFAAMYNYGG
jgi:hypothetical protein